MKAVLYKMIAYGFGTLGFLMLISTFLNFDMISNNLNKWLGMLAFLALVPLMIALIFYRKALKVFKDTNYRKYEARIIDMAQQNKGIVTAAQVTIKTKLTFKEAEGFLKEMYLSGLFDMDMNDEGRIEYSLKP